MNQSDKNGMDIPKPVQSMIAKFLGVDPSALLAQIATAIQMMQNFCVHFDHRMVAVAEQLKAQKEEIEKLRELLETKSKPKIEIVESDGLSLIDMRGNGHGKATEESES